MCDQDTVSIKNKKNSLTLQWAKLRVTQCFLVVLNTFTLKQTHTVHLTHMVMGCTMSDIELKCIQF